MKRFDELKGHEILALTEEQIQWHMDFACAEDGAPLMPPHPGDAPPLVKATPDRVLYEVDGLYFDTIEDAQEVATLVNSKRRFQLDYAPGGDYTNRIAKPKDNPIGVDSTPAFTLNHWDTVKAEVLAYQSAKDRWERDLKEWNDASNKRARAAGWVIERIDEEREKDAQRTRFESELKRYIELANGDEEMARKFLLKARPEAADYLPPMPPVDAQAVEA